MVGRHVRTRAGVLGAVMRDAATLAEEASIASRAYALLDYGKKIAEGRPVEVRRHPAVIEAYLGGTLA